jgi:aspartyl aminopeptidase
VSDRVRDLLDFIDASPTPYHAVSESVRRLEAAGFRELSESEPWSFSPGDRWYLSRSDGSLLALVIGDESPAQRGFRIIGAHTDSPNLRLRPIADVSAHGYRQLAVEPYGGVLLHTWFDRDLSLAGRVVLAAEGGPSTLLVDLERPLLRIPHLAIHLDRDSRETGLRLNPQLHAVPLLGLARAPDLRTLLIQELRAHPELLAGSEPPGRDGAKPEPRDVLAYDLMLYDVQPPSRAGAEGEFILAPRLDNLASCHAIVCALAEAAQGLPARFTRVAVLYDHEEVGSRSLTGAWGPFLLEALDRCVQAFKGGEAQGLPRALARSRMISADMAHAIHPNFADRHEPGHAPRLGGGPVLKVNANQSYASDARTSGFFTALCRAEGIEPQHFAARNDMPCGSTIGPISAARVGVPTVDVGNPMLSMHSCREMAGSADVEPMIAVLRSFYSLEDS